MGDTSDSDAKAQRAIDWSARIVPGLGLDAELTDEQKLACAFRVLVAEDFSENLAGHITWTNRNDGSMLVNPWGLWWSELNASDICRVDAEAKTLATHIGTPANDRACGIAARIYPRRNGDSTSAQNALITSDLHIVGHGDCVEAEALALLT